MHIFILTWKIFQVSFTELNLSHNLIYLIIQNSGSIKAWGYKNLCHEPMKIICFFHWDNISLRKTKHEKETKTCQKGMSRGKTMSRSS
jgi:hypothetical protein